MDTCDFLCSFVLDYARYRDRRSVAYWEERCGDDRIFVFFTHLLFPCWGLDQGSP